MDYKAAKKNNKGWEGVHDEAKSFFRELQTMERSHLANDKEFLHNLDKMIDIYQEARERSTALKFEPIEDKRIHKHMDKYEPVLKKLAKDE